MHQPSRERTSVLTAHWGISHLLHSLHAESRATAHRAILYGRGFLIAAMDEARLVEAVSARLTHDLVPAADDQVVLFTLKADDAQVAAR